MQALKKDPHTRLGHKDDINEIKAHPWFKDIDWNALVKKQVSVSSYQIIIADSCSLCANI